MLWDAGLGGRIAFVFGGDTILVRVCPGMIVVLVRVGASICSSVYHYQTNRTNLALVVGGGRRDAAAGMDRRCWWCRQVVLVHRANRRPSRKIASSRANSDAIEVAALSGPGRRSRHGVVVVLVAGRRSR